MMTAPPRSLPVLVPLTDDELGRLLAAADAGTPGGMSPEQAVAVTRWAERTRVAAGLLTLALAGDVAVDATREELRFSLRDGPWGRGAS
jgi:hypothetical protein